jgi:WD40 repeat protein
VTLIVPSNGVPKSATVYVSSSSCGTTDGCFSTIVPITAPANTVGNFITLPTTPNSLVFNPLGSKAYLGTDSGLFGSVGMAVLDANANSVGQVPNLPGKVLTVSPDGTKVIVSDTSPADGQNQVFVFDTTTNAGSAFQISGATAAAFSPDSLKAYIIAGSTLYVYSKFDALKTIPLAAPANDVAFLSEGAFAYIAGGDPAGVAVRRTCDNGMADKVTTLGAAPTFIRTLPGPAQLLPGDVADSLHLLTLSPPNIGIISANHALFPAAPWEGCTPVVIDNNPLPQFFNLGQGNFVPKQLIVSQDGSTAYILTSNLSSILVFGIPGQVLLPGITLAGNAIPVSATLTPDGTLLYVGASDHMVHVLETASGTDIQQISFPQGLCQNSIGQPASINCLPDLVAVKP